MRDNTKNCVLLFGLLFCAPLRAGLLHDISRVRHHISRLAGHVAGLVDKAQDDTSGGVGHVAAKVALTASDVANKLYDRIDDATDHVLDAENKAANAVKGEAEQIIKKVQKDVDAVKHLAEEFKDKLYECTGFFKQSTAAPVVIASNAIARTALAAAKAQLTVAQKASAKGGKVAVKVGNDTWHLTRDMIKLCHYMCADIKSMSFRLSLKPPQFDATVKARVLGKDVTVGIDPKHIKKSARAIFRAAK